MARLGLGALVVFLLGCGGARIPPRYTERELKQQCERHGFWWHEDDLRGGFCETPSMM